MEKGFEIEEIKEIKELKTTLEKLKISNTIISEEYMCYILRHKRYYKPKTL